MILIVHSVEVLIHPHEVVSTAGKGNTQATTPLSNVATNGTTNRGVMSILTSGKKTVDGAITLKIETITVTLVRQTRRSLITSGGQKGMVRVMVI